MANIRISDDIYTKLKAFADGEMRSVANATEYLLNKQLENTPVPKNTPYQNPGGTAPSSDVSDLLKDEEGAWEKNPTTKKSGATPRNKGDVLADIRETEAERDEELRFCQDAEESKKITDRYAPTIAGLWNEYHFLKEAE